MSLLAIAPQQSGDVDGLPSGLGPGDMTTLSEEKGESIFTSL